MITFAQIKENEEIKACILRGDKALLQTNFTEHGMHHVMFVVHEIERLLRTLGYEERMIEIAKIAAYMHDIGNSVNRKYHAQTGAVLAYTILSALNMEPAEKMMIVNAIGNHDEKTAETVSPIACALILADKCDVRRSRVRNREQHDFNIHNEVNYAVLQHETSICLNDKTFTLKLQIDTDICKVIDFFEIFLRRMKLCSRASRVLGLEFHLIINNHMLS